MVDLPENEHTGPIKSAQHQVFGERNQGIVDTLNEVKVKIIVKIKARLENVLVNQKGPCPYRKNELQVPAKNLSPANNPILRFGRQEKPPTEAELRQP